VREPPQDSGVPPSMSATWNYIGVTSVALAVSGMLAWLGFRLATENFFTPADPPIQSELARAQGLASGHVLTSPLLGRSPEKLVANTDADSQRQREGEWVEVTDAVNMRSGGSSSDPVVKVQLEGKRLRVAAREGGWIEVIDPKTEGTGWVYERYVKPIEAESKQADLVEKR